MKLAFLLNSIQDLDTRQSTSVLAFTAHKKDYSTYFISLGDFIYREDGSLAALAVSPPKKSYQNVGTFLKGLEQMKEAVEVSIEELDVLLLRYYPEEFNEENRWALEAGKIFSRIAMKKGVLVLNEPTTHIYTSNKMYLQEFPEEVRLPTLISRSIEKIRKFYKDQNQKLVLKPLTDSDGADIFYLEENATNLNQMVAAIGREGYVVAQQYLDLDIEGKIILLMMNGEALQYKEKYCAVLYKGGKAEKINTKQIKPALQIAEVVGPRLKQDGVFMASLEISGDKLLAVNTMSDRVLCTASELYKIAFAERIIDSLTKKLEISSHYQNHITNKELAIYE